LIHIGGKTYELVQENRNGYNFEAFRDRYSEVLERYDYIVGDWGYNQLRLKGFFKESNKNGNKDTCVSSMHDYLNEYCNFGCAYFILRKLPGKSAPGESQPVAPELQEAALPGGASQAQQPNPQHEANHSRHNPPRQERHERHDRQERHGQAERHERHGNQERPERPERRERQDQRHGHQERAVRTERNGQPERHERPERHNRERQERSQPKQ
jgi:uncharacterized protein YutD